MSLTAIILTFNEEKHIARCINSARLVASNIVIIDSFSNDKTIDIATKNGAKIYQNQFINQADQLNWGLANIAINTEWILRLDADEYLSNELVEEINRRTKKLDSDISGILIKRNIRFLRKNIRYGGFGHQWIIRLWRNGTGYCETRWMDEHMRISHGKINKYQHPLVDENLNGIGWWTNKHNNYASREAIDLLRMEYQESSDKDNTQDLKGSARRKRWVKKHIYLRLPLGLRPTLYYLYRMFFLLGVLDGPKGWIFHSLQGGWYRLLVDIKIWEVKKNMQEHGNPVDDAIKQELGIDPQATSNNP